MAPQDEKDNPLASRRSCALIGVFLILIAIIFGWAFLAIFPHVDKSAPVYGDWRIGSFVLIGQDRGEGGDTKPWIPLTPDRGLVMLAAMAGILGSFLHASLSFAAYVGYRQLRQSWVWWYYLRPFIGAVLGVLFYFVIRAGLLGGNEGASVSPYGVVALAGLAGWFSKNATDKLAEVFDTLFKTDKKLERDALAESRDAPRIFAIAPSPVPKKAWTESGATLTITGENFKAGSQVDLAGTPLKPASITPTTLKLVIPPQHRPGAGETVEIRVIVTEPAKVESKPFKLTFE